MKVFEGVVQNWWRQGNHGRIEAHYDGIVAFSQTDFTPDLKKMSVPTLVMHGDDDQIVPYQDAGVLAAKIVKNAILKIYKGFPHGMLTPNPRVDHRVWNPKVVAENRRATYVGPA